MTLLLIFRRWSLLCLAGLLVVGCKSSQPQQASTAAAIRIPSNFQLFLTRSGCFGRCPAYELSVDAEGIVKYQGHMNVPHLGRHRKELSEAQLQTLAQFISEARFFADNLTFFELDSTYDEGLTDLPTVITEVVLGERSHKVVSRDGPKEVQRFQDRLDEIIGPAGYEPVEKE